MLSNGCWSCQGMPGHGIPDIGMPMVTANWALGVVSPLLSQVLLVGIVLPMPGQALLWALSAHAGIVLPMLALSHMTSGIPMAVSYYCQLLLLALPTQRWLLQAVGIVIVGIIFVGCSWHCYCWRFMALFLSWQWQ